MKTITCIQQKEDIAQLHFPNSEVLEDKILIQERIRSLNNSLTLGNLEHCKVRIFFEDIEGQKMVETTIWGITDSHLILKKGVTLPIKRIIKIES